MEAQRSELKSAHDEYQKQFLPTIRYGGGLVRAGVDVSSEVDIRDVIGNVIVFEAPNKQFVEDFHSNDPYTKAGLFEIVVVEQFWQRVPEPQ